jgi:hypothetical protein
MSSFYVQYNSRAFYLSRTPLNDTAISLAGEWWERFVEAAFRSSVPVKTCAEPLRVNLSLPGHD